MNNTLDLLCMGCFAQLPSPGAYCFACGYAPGRDAEVQHRLTPKTVLSGKYMVGKPLGEGGFGITYLGYDLNLDIKVAIKEFYPFGFVTRSSTQSTTVQPLAGEQGEFFLKGRERFVDEAKRLAKFRTFPGIVVVNDFFVENGTAYIVMEYVEGETLKNYMAQQGGRLPADMILAMMKPMFQSLSQIHAEGLIHRDISPDNIMVTHGGEVKLLDFGAAREFGEDGNKSLSVMLKHGYAPPEQYTSRGVQGPHTDVYALCATIYKAVTGVTPEGSMDRVMHDHLAPPSVHGAQIPYHAEVALMKGLAVKAVDRFQTVSELYTALYNSQLGGSPVGRDAPGAPPSPSAPQYAHPPQTSYTPQQPPSTSYTPQPAYGQYPPQPVGRDALGATPSPPTQHTSYAPQPAYNGRQDAAPTDANVTPAPNAKKPMAKSTRNAIIAAAVGGCLVIALVVALTTRQAPSNDASTDDPNSGIVATPTPAASPSPASSTVLIPSGLIGKTQDEVEELLGGLDITVSWNEDYDENTLEGSVAYVQSEGQSVPAGSEIEVIVSLGSSDPVNQFVSLLYTKSMGHPPNLEYRNYWSGMLRSGAASGAEFAYELLFGDEFQSRGLGNEDFVEVLYEALFNRQPDSSGKDYWVSQLYEARSRENVFAGFVDTSEFEELCNEYGIYRGAYAPVKLNMELVSLIGITNAELKAINGEVCWSFFYNGGPVVDYGYDENQNEISVPYSAAFFIGGTDEEVYHNQVMASIEVGMDVNLGLENTFPWNIWSDHFTVYGILNSSLDGNLGDFFNADYPITLEDMQASFTTTVQPYYYTAGEHYEWGEYDICYAEFMFDSYLISATFRLIGGEYVLFEVYIYGLW